MCPAKCSFALSVFFSLYSLPTQNFVNSKSQRVEHLLVWLTNTNLEEKKLQNPICSFFEFNKSSHPSSVKTIERCPSIKLTARKNLSLSLYLAQKTFHFSLNHWNCQLDRAAF